jgi:protein gp37
MGATGIEWTQGPNGEQGYSFSPWWGCTRVSPACDHCYAAGAAIKNGIVWDGPVTPVGEAAWDAMRALDRRARRLGCRFRVFTGSMCDVLDKNGIPVVRDRLWRLIEETPNLDWMILTKRPQLARRFMPIEWFTGNWPMNAWFGFTAENQTEWNRRWPYVDGDIPSPCIFVSAEPLLEGYHLPDNAARLGLFIVGGESGVIANCRPTPDRAFEWMAQQCGDLRIPFFMKQLDQVNHRGSFVVGDRPDGSLIRKPAYKHFPSFPPALRLRQQPRLVGVEHRAVPA